MTDSVRRSVSIPIVSNGKNVLALAEIGAKLWSKDFTYRLFFEKAVESVEELLIAEIVRRGGNTGDYASMLSKAEEKLKAQGLTGASNTPAPVVNRVKDKVSADVKGAGKKPVAKKKKVAIN